VALRARSVERNQVLGAPPPPPEDPPELLLEEELLDDDELEDELELLLDDDEEELLELDEEPPEELEPLDDELELPESWTTALLLVTEPAEFETTTL
jgi:hypothetical protein